MSSSSSQQRRRASDNNNNNSSPQYESPLPPVRRQAGLKKVASGSGTSGASNGPMSPTGNTNNAREALRQSPYLSSPTVPPSRKNIASAPVMDSLTRALLESKRRVADATQRLSLLEDATTTSASSKPQQQRANIGGGGGGGGYLGHAEKKKKVITRELQRQAAPLTPPPEGSLLQQPTPTMTSNYRMPPPRKPLFQYPPVVDKRPTLKQLATANQQRRQQQQQQEEPSQEVSAAVGSRNIVTPPLAPPTKSSSAQEQQQQQTRSFRPSSASRLNQQRSPSPAVGEVPPPQQPRYQQLQQRQQVRPSSATQRQQQQQTRQNTSRADIETEEQEGLENELKKKAMKRSGPVHTFVYQKTAGSVFEHMRKLLLKRREWVEARAYLTEASGTTASRAGSAAPAATRATKTQQGGATTATTQKKSGAYAVGGKKNAAANVMRSRPINDDTKPSGPKKTPCCSKLSGVSLFIGDKPTAEYLLDEAQRYAMKNRRLSNAMYTPLTCTHPTYDEVNPVPSTSQCFVNYFEGMKRITLKAKLFKTFEQYFRGDRARLWQFLPETYMVSPTFRDDRDSLVLAMKAATQDLVEIWQARQSNLPKVAQRKNSTSEKKQNGGSGDDENDDDENKPPVSKWIAKSSHGKGGDGIQMVDGTQKGYQNVMQLIDRQPEGHCWVVQRYVERPLLYRGRKFDLRVWVLVTAPPYAIYMHREGVMRTSSHEYDPNATSILAHITNHCLQATSTEYAAYEKGNELFFDTLDMIVRRQHQQLQREFGGGGAGGSPSKSVMSALRHAGVGGHNNNNSGGGGGSLESVIMPQFRRIITQSLLAAKPHLTLDGNYTSINRFQFLGFDFIIDDMLKVWLLEINGAPGIADRLQDTIVKDMMEIVIDGHFEKAPPATQPAALEKGVIGDGQESTRVGHDHEEDMPTTASTPEKQKVKESDSDNSATFKTPPLSSSVKKKSSSDSPSASVRKQLEEEAKAEKERMRVNGFELIYTPEMYAQQGPS